MRKVSRLLCYLIRYNSSIPANIIRILTKSLLLSKLSYSIPFITMSLATSNQLQSALMAPMKKILALPTSAKTLRVHIDTGIPCMHTIHFTRCASMLYKLYHPTITTNDYSYQLLTKPNTYFTYTKWVTQAAAAINTTLFKIRKYKPLLFVWAYACDVLQFDPTINQRNVNTHLAHLSTKHEFNDWLHDPAPDELKLYKTKYGVSDTIKYDNKWHAQLRARLRHNRSDLNASLHHMSRIDSPHCINCNLHVPETNQHALIECDKHKSIRDEYIVKIHDVIRSQQLTIPMLLWSDTWNIVRDKQILLRTITGRYISDIMKNRLEYIPFMI